MKTYAILNIVDLDKVNFNEVNQTSAATVRKSLDGSQFILKWNDVTPSFIAEYSITLVYSGDKTGLMTIINGPDWTPVEI